MESVRPSLSWSVVHAEGEAEGTRGEDNSIWRQALTGLPPGHFGTVLISRRCGKRHEGAYGVADVRQIQDTWRRCGVCNKRFQAFRGLRGSAVLRPPRQSVPPPP